VVIVLYVKLVQRIQNCATLRKKEVIRSVIAIQDTMHLPPTNVLNAPQTVKMNLVIMLVMEKHFVTVGQDFM